VEGARGKAPEKRKEDQEARWIMANDRYVTNLISSNLEVSSADVCADFSS
jgi:hypothetical protein